MKPPAGAVQENPFPGLRPFREDEEHLFFGRENQVDAMVDKLASTRFLAVVGTSGSGKSSLVNCGLRPALRQGLMAQAGTSWRMAQFRPGNDPIGEMARALAQDGVLFDEREAIGLSLTDIVQTSLRMSKLGLVDIVEQAALAPGVNLLVVVDQFEELFRFRQLGAADRAQAQGGADEAAAFVKLLLEIKEQPACPIFIVLTMRSDFLGECTQFPGLAEAINAGQYLVPRMTRDERRAAILGPAAVGGAAIAPPLLTRLVNDVGDNPDQLSILQHALNRTWVGWQAAGGAGPLSLPHYEAIGTMAHALDQHAEQAYAELGGPRQQQICQTILRALTDKATDPRGVRRPITLATLCRLAEASAEEVGAVIGVFRDPSRSFLMPPAGQALAADTVIDISHASLMRVWQRLGAWADDEARSARRYRRLVETASLHAQDRASAWTGPDLQFALDWRHAERPNEAWADRYAPGFAQAMRFVDLSRKLEEGAHQRDDARTRGVWILVPLMLLLAPTLYLGPLRHDLSYLYVPLAAWLGYAFRRTGVVALGLGAMLLLPPMWVDTAVRKPSDVGLYLLCLAVARILAAPEGFFVELGRLPTRRTFYLLSLLLLGISASYYMQVGADLGLRALLYGAIFVFGMGALPARRFAAVLALVVAAGTIVMLFSGDPAVLCGKEASPPLRLAYRLSTPWDFGIGMLFFLCGRLTRHGLSGSLAATGAKPLAMAAAVMFVLYINLSLALNACELPWHLPILGSRYTLFYLPYQLLYAAAFTCALLLRRRGLWTILFAGAAALLLTGPFTPYAPPTPVGLMLRIGDGWSLVEVIFIAFSFGLFGNAVGSRFSAIGNGYVAPEGESALRAAEASAQRSRKWLRWVLSACGVAVVLLIVGVKLAAHLS